MKHYRGSFLDPIFSSGLAMEMKNPFPAIPTVGTVISPTQPADAEDSSGDVSWGIIVPVVLVGLFVVAVIVCLYCHSLRQKRRRDTSNIADTSLGRFSRSLVNSTAGIDYVRGSTRSTMPLGTGSIRGCSASAVQIPHQQYYTPEGQAKFTFYWDKDKDNWKLCPDSVANIRGHHNPLSPIDEMDSSLLSEDIYTDGSKSYELCAQAPFSPYHLTWVTPQAPPPSYEESEVGSPEKRLKLHSINTTQSETTFSTCHTFEKDPFYPHNNTPTTDCELSAHNASVQVKSAVLSEGLTNTNSQMTSYPSTPPSEPSLTTSSLDSGEDNASFVTSYHDTSYHISRQSVNNQSSTAPTSLRASQEESEMSGIPSLPSSILCYHQKMSINNLVSTGKAPRFSFSHPYNQSMASSMESAESHYTDNTSLLPNVGSSNTSGNPSVYVSIQQTSGTGAVEHSQQSSPTQDLSKIVDELSSIRPGSAEPVSINKGLVNSGCFCDKNIGESYVTEQINPQSASDADNIRHSLTELFRSWSVTAELDYSSGNTGSMITPQHDNSFAWDNYPWQKKQGDPVEQPSPLTEDYNHNVIGSNATGSAIDINQLPIPGRKVTFDIPVLVSKTYWV